MSRTALALVIIGSLIISPACKTESTTPEPPEPQYMLTVTATPSNGGTVARSPNQASYAPGTVVTLTATPAANYVFTRWAGDVNGTDNPATVTMSANRSVSAVFTSTTPMYALSVTVSPSIGGSVAKSPLQDEYAPGTAVTLTATPASGYAFTRWEGDLTGTANPAAVTMDAAKSVVAVFSATTQYVLTVAVSPSGGGTVTRSPDQAQYDPATVVILTATPASGYAFTRWDGGLTGTSNPITIAMTSNRSVTAVFSATATPLIELTPKSLDFLGKVGESAPPAQTVSVTNGGQGTLSGLVRSFPDGAPSWLTATLSGATAPATLSVQVSMNDPLGHPLAAGTYTTRVAVTSAAAGNSPQDVAVTFRILSEATLTATAAYDNVVQYSSIDGSMANMVYPDTPLAVGVDYLPRTSGYDTHEAASALLFDIQPQIAGRLITRATLRLYVLTVRGDLAVMPQIRVSAFATLWNPAILTWNAWQTMQVQPTGTAIQSAPASAAAPVDFDVTTIVRNWASGTWLNYGLQIDGLAHYYPASLSLQTTRFQSLERFDDLSRRPRLIVEFQ